MAELRTQEQQLLSAIDSLGGTATVEQLIQACGMQDTAVMRNALTLQEKNFVSIRAKIQNVIKLTKEGEQYAKDGLPERNLILATAELGGTADLQAAAKKANLTPEFIQIALGWTIRKKWATYTPQNNTLHITEVTPSPNNPAGRLRRNVPKIPKYKTPSRPRRP
jgi:phenylalanyl-tRNA synthetase alpha chain